MRKLLILFCQNPWIVLSSILLISILAASQLSHVRVQISAEDLLVQDDPERAYFEKITQQFGDEKVILLYLSDEQILEKDKLETLKTVIGEIETLDFVDRAESLFSVPYLKTIDGYLNKDPYLAELPATAEQAGDLLDKASLNPFIKHTLLSDNHQVMAVAIILKNDLAAFTDQLITDALKKASSQLESSYAQVFTIGYQHVRQEVAEEIKAEQGDLVPIAVAALLIALFILLRQLLDILIPVMTAGLSILWTLGLMGFFDIPLNVVTSMVPILLIIVGSTEDIHLLAEFRRGQHNGMEKLKAIEQMAKKMGGIIALTFITTYMGFLSVSLSKIEVLWQFGALSATALMINFIITISLIPALLRLAGNWQLDGHSRFFKSPDVEPSRARSFYLWLHRFRWFIGFGVLGISIASIAGMFLIKVNHSPIDSLSKDSQVKAHFEFVNDHLSGLESMSIILDSGIQDTFLKVRYLEEINAIQEYMLSNESIRSTTSFNDYLSLLNAAFEELPEPLMPDSDEIISELMIFLKYQHVQAYVSEDFSKARILVRHNISSTHELQQVVDGLREYIDKNLDEGLEGTVTGDSVLTLSATKAMISGQLQSILVLLGIIIVIISMLFLDWKVGLIAAIPNIFPVIVLFGVMGLMDIPLNIGTTMAAAIAIGIAVDDTMHFMLRYNSELKSKKSKYAAMYETLHSEALPVFASSLALISGFLVFSFSSFEPVAQFGLLSAIVMFAALVADFVITPLAISTLRLVTLWDLLSLSLRREVIEKSLLFKDMRPWQIRKFILASSVQHFRKGQKIFNQNDESDSMYMVMRGNVLVRHIGTRDDEEILETILPGDVFGDISMLANLPRSSEATATEQTSLLVLTMDSIHSTTNYHPVISSKLFFNIATHVSQRFSALIHKQG